MPKNKREMTEEEFIQRQLDEHEVDGEGKIVPSNPLPSFFHKRNKKSVRRAKRTKKHENR